LPCNRIHDTARMPAARIQRLTDQAIHQARGDPMPLMAADVRNVTFSKLPIGKRGYHEDEVDAFLDLVVSELARWIQESTGGLNSRFF